MVLAKVFPRSIIEPVKKEKKKAAINLVNLPELTKGKHWDELTRQEKDKVIAAILAQISPPSKSS